MNLELIALTLDFVGKVSIAAVALLVHRRLETEKRIDIEVLKEMQLEQIIGALGIIFLATAYVMHLNML